MQNVLATIIGSGVNQDGATAGITVPSARAQQDLMHRVCARAGTSPSDIGFFEAHGTGTPVGDPLEVEAIRALLAEDGPQSEVILTSVKAGIGHLEAAAGVAGLLKAAICAKSRLIGPQAWLEQINPALNIEDSPLCIPISSPITIGRGSEPIIGAVNSFGYGGSNAHILVMNDD